MDFDSVVDNLTEIQEPPPILSSGVREVFPLFANMLDINSFMKLAMTNKEMYERCMEDKRIRINLEEKEVQINATNGLQMTFHSFDIADEHMEKYLEMLRQLKCNVCLKRIHFQGPQIDTNTVMEARRYLGELGVKTIDRLKIDGTFTDWQQFSFIKDFNVKNVDIKYGLSEDALRSLLESNLNSFTYRGQIQGELLLQVDSLVPYMMLPSMQLSADVLMQILWKIQTGALTKLYVSSGRTPWDRFTQLPDTYDEPLPAERPLLLNFSESKFFLHWDGGVTICRLLFVNDIAEFSKCEDVEDLAVLKSKERVHKELVENSHTVYCIKSHFLSFFDGIPFLESSHEGPFSEERPLVCKSDEDPYTADPVGYYLLNEDGSMDVYLLYEEHVYCEGKFDMEEKWPIIDNHTPLQKFVFDKRIQKKVSEGDFQVEGINEFRFLFEDCKRLPRDFRGELPEKRPLVFESTVPSKYNEEKEDEYRIILYEDGTLVQYKYNDIAEVNISPCPSWNRPSFMISSENLKEIILDAPFHMLTYSIDLATFRAAFRGIETLPFHAFGDLREDRPLAFKKTELHDEKILEQYWVLLEDGKVRKCEWKDDRATFTRGDPQEFPFLLTKTLVKDYFEGKLFSTDVFVIERDVLNLCLEGCVIHAFDVDDSDLLLYERPLIFGKTEVKHTCQKDPNGDCECIEEILHLCFVDDLERVIHIRWEDRLLSFNKRPSPNDLPPILKTKEMLEYLLEAPWSSDEWYIDWYGSSEDYHSCFESHRMIDFDHEGRLPRTRPLVFTKHNSDGFPLIYWYLRKDGLVIECRKRNSPASLIVNSEYLPPAISSSS